MAALQKLANNLKIKKLQRIYALYWLLLAYIIAALIFWFIALNKQVDELALYRRDLVSQDDPNFTKKLEAVTKFRHRKTTQYLAEGITFLLLIITGAVVVFRAVRRQFLQSQQQQNFMMAITHELKTPIAVTKLNLETLQKRTLQPDQQQRLLSSTIQEADRLNALCNNLLLTSQIEAGGYEVVKEKVSLSDLAELCVKEFKSRYPQRTIRLEATSQVFIEGDNMLLYLVVNNLLDNAIKYSGQDDLVLIKVFQKQNRVNLSVSDEGAGIPKTLWPKVFEKYYRGSRRAKGTGLGLYISRKIADQHKATIQIEANQPKGTTFVITFPTSTN